MKKKTKRTRRRRQKSHISIRIDKMVVMMGGEDKPARTQLAERACEYCGSKFQPKREWQRFCKGKTPDCATEWHKADRAKVAT